MRSVVGVRKLAGVKLLAQIGLSVVSDRVKATRDASQKPSFGKLWATVSGMTGAAEIFDSLRSEVPVLIDELQDAVIGFDHPLRIFSHDGFSFTYSHDRCFDSYVYLCYS
mgnify:CR=1 FL=1